MSGYTYENEKKNTLTDQGQEILLAIYGQVLDHLSKVQSIVMSEAIQLPPGIGASDTWTMMACVDRLVELGILREVSTNGCAQDRVFLRGAKFPRYFIQEKN